MTQRLATTQEMMEKARVALGSDNNDRQTLANCVEKLRAERDTLRLEVDCEMRKCIKAHHDLHSVREMRADSELRFDALMYALICIPSEGVEAGVAAAHALHRQRDALLAACVAAEEDLDEVPGRADPPSLAQVRAAIALAKVSP